MPCKPSPLLGSQGQGIVLGQKARLEGHHRGVLMIMSMVMPMSLRVAVMGSVCMDTVMIVAVSIAMRMFMSMNVGVTVMGAIGMDVFMLVAMSCAIGVVMPMHRGVANAVGMNMLMLVAKSRSIGVLMLGMAGAAGMNMFMLMRVSPAMGMLMAMVMGVVVMRAVFMSMVITRDGDRSRPSYQATSWSRCRNGKGPQLHADSHRRWRSAKSGDIAG
jgi:hypothetical protein